MANEDQNTIPAVPASSDEPWRTTLEAALRVLDYHSSHAAQRPAEADEQADKAVPLHSSAG